MSQEQVFTMEFGVGACKKVAIFDEADRKALSAMSWRVRRDAERPYVVSKGAKTVIAHRFLTGALPGEKVDHINGNTLDNRRANLRRCTNAQNIRNSRKYRSGSVSQYKGVTTSRGQWRAQICCDYKKYNLGTFATEEEAAMAYDREAVKRFGGFARLNFSSKDLAGSKTTDRREACK